MLRAHSGHAFSRVLIRTTASPGKRCTRAVVTVLRGGSDTTATALDGLRLQTCTKGRYRILSLQHPGSSSSATHR